MGSCLSKSPGAADPPPADPSVAASRPLSLSQRWTKRWEERQDSKLRKRNAKVAAKSRGAAIAIPPECGGAGGRSASADELYPVAGRLVLNGWSEVASIYTQQGKKGTNQDAMIIWENFSSSSDTIFCGVFDGHGPSGHIVAKKVRDSLPVKILNQWRATMSGNVNGNGNGNVSLSRSSNSEDSASVCNDEELGESTLDLDEEENEKIPEALSPLKNSFLKAFKLMDKELKLHPNVDCYCSGTTAVTVVKKGQELVIGNLGDSRAILGTRDEDNNLVAVQLTVDLKPNLPREAERIQRCKGRVFALQDEPEVARVWLPNSDSPGLAMARAFGDFCLKDYGLISVPQVSYRHLTDRDKFIILATDGVWDVLSNKEAVEIVDSAPTRATAARFLVDSAVRSWHVKFPTSKIDDCAVVCLFLDSKSPSDPVVQTEPEPLPPEPVNPISSSPNNEESESYIPVDIEPSLEHVDTLCGTDEIVPVSDEPDIVLDNSVPVKMHERSQSARSLADCISNPEEEEYSALEGVTRANSIVNIPRFLSGDKKSSNWRKKWL